MASASTATIPSICKVCSAEFACRASNGSGCCSTTCMNIARTDHSPETLLKRFWAKVDKSPGHGPEGECWLWTARVDGRGYGEIKVSGQYKKAHRIALFGPENIQDRRMACHRCDNPRCVRPDHLFAGEAIDNVRDMVAKGRGAQAENGHRTRKLDDDAVRDVRASTERLYILAKRYGVDGSAIRQIRLGATYRDVR